jgi:dihydroorotase
MNSIQLIKNATIVNDGRTFVGSVVIENEIIKSIYEGIITVELTEPYTEIDATGLLLLPGLIDDQVHFREPGLTHKGDIYSESKAAVAGGITSYFEMPNTRPQATTIDILEDKYELASQKSFANYSFLMGVTNDNLDELKKVNPRNVAGIKMFMGSSTGNMLVDNHEMLNRVFSEIQLLIVTHCEDETTIQNNIKHYKTLLGDDIPVKYHPLIRNDEACYKSSAYAVELATKYNSRLHVFHLSSAKEMSLFSSDIPLKDKLITSEVCVHHLWFSDADYAKFGNRIKWNPAIKSEADRLALIDAVNSNKIDVIATDHAPHLLSEKEGSCLNAASGGPLVQHSLVAMLQMVKQGSFTLEKLVDKMCHAPAELFRVDKRGYIREGYYADLVLVNPQKQWTVNSQNILYKCGWSPFEGCSFDASIAKTWVNGHLVYNEGKFDETIHSKRLLFNV